MWLLSQVHSDSGCAPPLHSGLGPTLDGLVPRAGLPSLPRGPAVPWWLISYVATLSQRRQRNQRPPAPAGAGATRTTCLCHSPLPSWPERLPQGQRRGQASSWLREEHDCGVSTSLQVPLRALMRKRAQTPQPDTGTRALPAPLPCPSPPRPPGTGAVSSTRARVQPVLQLAVQWGTGAPRLWVKMACLYPGCTWGTPGARQTRPALVPVAVLMWSSYAVPGSTSAPAVRGQPEAPKGVHR